MTRALEFIYLYHRLIQDRALTPEIISDQHYQQTVVKIDLRRIEKQKARTINWTGTGLWTSFFPGSDQVGTDPWNCSNQPSLNRICLPGKPHRNEEIKKIALGTLNHKWRGIQFRKNL